MFMQATESLPAKQDEEFSRPVESIMRCEDFKSNFARRLSNRYTSRSSVTSSRQDTTLKLRPSESSNAEMIPDNVPERIEQCPQLSKSNNLEQNAEAVRVPVKTAANTDMRHTEVTALHMEVDTLRWQLAQTEANRQMHIALLKQIVSFLNRVKDHFEYQKVETGSMNESLRTRVLPSSFNSTDLPRSHSVVHVNKHLEYPLTPGKKISTRKISKSISNVNGFKDSSGLWNQSKISLTSETDNSQKINEEMSRLITLSNTVLSTKLPDLACAFNENESNNCKLSVSAEIKASDQNVITSSMGFIEEDVQSNKIILSSNCESADIYDELSINSFSNDSDPNLKNFTEPAVEAQPTCGIINNFSDINIRQNDQKCHIPENKYIGKTSKVVLSKRLDYNNKTNHFVEDESGFSSMSSFQEIGIPIISIIPPSPCKEIGYDEGIPEILDSTGKWKADIELNKQTVKVFWV